MDASRFEMVVEKVLVPVLPPGHIVILDNDTLHQSARTQQLIEACGCQLSCLPSYSPDVKPIARAFSTLKAWLRAANVWTQHAFDGALASNHQNNFSSR
ncbi:MAG: transposase [Trueperaceae bacterium]